MAAAPAKSNPEPESESKRPLRLGSDPPLSLSSHCIVVPGAAHAKVVEAAERLSAAIAAISGVRLLTVSEGRWAQNRGFHASGIRGASSTRCRTPLALGCSAEWLADCGLLSEATVPKCQNDSALGGREAGARGGWVRTVQYVDYEVELEPGEPPTQLMATALLVGGDSTASIVSALEWTSSEGLARLARGAHSLEADFAKAATAASENKTAAPCFEGQRVTLVGEGLAGVCVKHLVDLSLIHI